MSFTLIATVIAVVAGLVALVALLGVALVQAAIREVMNIDRAERT
jgi:hypothetical protein